MLKVDRKMQWLSRVFLLAFTWTLYQLLFIGELSYNSMGSEKTITAQSTPFKFYFAMGWCSLMVCVTVYFGFIVRRK